MSTYEIIPFFAPELFISNGVKDISFYEAAFGATELRRFSNDDGSIHVAELSIHGALFHLHEITAKPYFLDPVTQNGTTVTIGLFVPDVDMVINSAIKAGATLIEPPQDYDYGYRQAPSKIHLGTIGRSRKKLTSSFPDESPQQVQILQTIQRGTHRTLESDHKFLYRNSFTDESPQQTQTL